MKVPLSRACSQIIGSIFSNFSFFFPLLKEAKSRTDIPIRALLLLKSDFFNFYVILAFIHSPSTILKMEYTEKILTREKINAMLGTSIRSSLRRPASWLLAPLGFACSSSKCFADFHNARKRSMPFQNMA